MNQEEDLLHLQISQAMRTRGAAPGFVSARGLFWYTLEGRGVGNVEGGKRKARGVVSGLPDCWLFWNGARDHVLIELKTEGGAFKMSQTIRFPELRKAGFQLHVARSVADWFDILRECKVPL